MRLSIASNSMLAIFCLIVIRSRQFIAHIDDNAPQLASFLPIRRSTLFDTKSDLCQETTMQVPTWENPVGTDGFEFIEYTAPDPKALGKLFERMGFTAIARHRHKDVTLYRQGDINFIVNGEPDS